MKEHVSRDSVVLTDSGESFTVRERSGACLTVVEAVDGELQRESSMFLRQKRQSVIITLTPFIFCAQGEAVGAASWEAVWLVLACQGCSLRV